jgi:hypothetical protein
MKSTSTIPKLTYSLDNYALRMLVPRSGKGAHCSADTSKSYTATFWCYLQLPPLMASVGPLGSYIIMTEAWWNWGKTRVCVLLDIGTQIASALLVCKSALNYCARTQNMKWRSLWGWSVRWSERLVPLLRNNWRQKVEAVCSPTLDQAAECRASENPDMRRPFHGSTCQSPVFHRGDPSIWDLWWKKYWDRFFFEYLDFFPLRYHTTH